MFEWLFGRRQPNCPLDAEATRWIHERLHWLTNEFGSDRLIDHPIIEPTDAFFPDSYDASPAAAEKMFARICNWMDVTQEIVELRFYDEDRRPQLVNATGHMLPGSAGTYQEGEDRFVINLNRSELCQPMDLVGTIAHELSHLRLLGENRFDGDSFDNELITDLTATFFGFGIFLANSPRAFPAQVGRWPGSQLNRPEYMSLPMLTYAMAVIADLRFEENPNWACHLNSSARAEWTAARRYLKSKEHSSHKR